MRLPNSKPIISEDFGLFKETEAEVNPESWTQLKGSNEKRI